MVAELSDTSPMGAAVTKSPMNVTSNASNVYMKSVEFFLLKDIFFIYILICYKRKGEEKD